LECLASCYEDWFDSVDRMVGSVLSAADRETVVHEVFFRLVSSPDLRRSFRGGAFGSWLRVVARNQAIDWARRRRLELDFGGDVADGGGAGRVHEQTEARLLLQALYARVPRKWQRVFVARFIEQQDQPTAARSLGIPRTTLAYQEYRIRRMLRKHILSQGGES
jgi:RNA polymerase sigma-70 factor (ECF subfamily)